MLVKEMVTREKVDFLGLVETKKRDVERSVVSAIWPQDEFEFLHYNVTEN